MFKVSIIIPVYNAELFIDKCIGSIINQTYKNLEIILINDGSSDRSGEICNNYALSDNRIQVIEIKNKGASFARNVGINLATGNYIMFVDSDDWIEKDMIENMINLLTEEKCDICISNYYRNIGENQREINLPYNENIIKGDKIKKQLIYPLIGKLGFNDPNQILGFGAVWAKLYSKSLLERENISFKEKLIIGEDTLFNIESFSKIDKIVVDRNNYYHYYDNSKSIMRKFKENSWTMYSEAIKEFDKFLNYDTERDEEAKLRFSTLIINDVKKSIINEVNKSNKKPCKEKIRYIKQICNDTYVENAILVIKNIKMSFSRKIYVLMIEKKCSIGLYLFFNYFDRG